MGKFDEYITSLEGKEDLNPLEVASKLHELHSEEIGVFGAKIEELIGTVAERDSSIADLNGEITNQKAKNFDLAMQIPGAQATDTDSHVDENHKSDITIDDLFEK